MSDWEYLVRARLRNLNLNGERTEDIVLELAGHLEEVFSELRRRGISEAEAIRRTLDEIPNWQRLRRRINRASRKEGNMTQLTKSLWIPGLVMTALLMAASVGVIRSGMFPNGLVLGSPVYFLIYVPWLASFFAIGALGSYWSRRMGGSVAVRSAVCMLPVAVLIAMFLFAAVPTLFGILFLAFQEPRLHATLLRASIYHLSCALPWVVYPSLALFVGAFPVAMSARETRAGSRCAD